MEKYGRGSCEGLIIVFILLNLSDFFLSKIIVFDLNIIDEANPIPRFLYSKFGILSILVLKILSVWVVCLFTAKIEKTNPKLAKINMYIACTILFLVNLLTLSPYYVKYIGLD